MEIKRFQEVPKYIQPYLDEAGGDITVGALYISKRDNDKIVRIRTLEFHKKTKHQEAYLEVHYDRADDWEATKFHRYGSDDVVDFAKKYLRLTKPLSQHLQEALDIIEGKKDISEYTDAATDSIGVDTGSALISKKSKEGLMAIQSHLEDKKKIAQTLAAFIGFEMEKRKQALEAIKEKMYGVVAEFKKKIIKIMRVITTIELYLGVDEEIFQLQDGPRAAADTPISFRQQVLYMDEETGHWEDGGLDFTDIEWFDNWLIKNENFKRLAPEQKCVLVFRPRRYRKDYEGDDWYGNAVKNGENLGKTYLLIRNGECLFRIYTEKIVILPRLFPRRKEFEQLLKEVEKEEWDRYKEEKKETIETKHYEYRKRAFILQGLIDRSEVFHPLSQQVSIFNMDKTPGAVNFIYDDEETLPSGRLPFEKWWKEINSKITAGSRVLVTGAYSYKHYGRQKDFSERFYLASNSPDGLRNVPDLPKEGVYEVEEFGSTYTRKYRESEYKTEVKRLTDEGKKFADLGIVKGRVWTHPDKVTGSNKIYQIRFYHDDTELTIMYMPDAEASAGWNRWEKHERKSRTRFKIYKEDLFIINYDQIDLADIEFYLTSRVDRPSYLDMMPILEKIKHQRLKEMVQEKDFMKFVVARNKDKIPGASEEIVRKMVVDSVIWWKYKNKWKRAITKDDTLALRMIEKRILSKNFKWFDKQNQK